MWTFAGLVFIGGVLWYWLRLIARILSGHAFVFEATINRAQERQGLPPIVSEEEAAARWP